MPGINLPGPVDEWVGITTFITLLKTGLWRTTSENLGRMGRGVRDSVHALGFEAFSDFWVPYRLVVGLQIRLFVETVLFTMGSPWSDLVSGFKPVFWNRLRYRKDKIGRYTPEFARVSRGNLGSRAKRLVGRGRRPRGPQRGSTLRGKRKRRGEI